jgi:hypothetical protein
MSNQHSFYEGIHKKINTTIEMIIIINNRLYFRMISLTSKKYELKITVN